MLRALKNSKGSIALALVVAVIGVLSGVSLASIAFRDSNSFRQQLEAVQEFHYLRSEVGRGRIVASVFEGEDNPPPQAALPIRKLNVNFGNYRTVYSANTKLSTQAQFAQTGFIIKSLISAVRGGGDIVTAEQQSPVKRYGENFIRSLQTMAIFHYFSDEDLDASGIPGNIRFWGPDVVYGRVHSNTDIYIRQAGGGSNNGWPTFHGLVTTAGEVLVYPGGGSNYPLDDVFRGGLIENYPRVAFDPDAALIRRNGVWPFGHASDENRIAFVDLDGGSFTSWDGNIVSGPVEEFVVYDSYPPYGQVGDSIGVNYITRRDTIWTPGPQGNLNNQSAFVPFELWISGSVRGRQTWGCSHNIYLKDDITYEGTIMGQPPDGGPDELYPVNSRDYFGLVSEKHILIQYGYRDPVDSLRYKPNTNNIYIYGALCAMGEGSGSQLDHDAGVFSFQYHFPKGSTPDQFYQGEYYTKIDLHRFRYPTTAFDPWPPTLDYPWYNPLWPEPGPANPPIVAPAGTPTVTYLRGVINLYGSVAQRRRGFVRRSGNADFDTGIWDLPDHVYGAPPNTLPGGSPSGYDKNYNFDTRFENVGPPDFPLVKFEGYDSDELMDLGYSSVSWVFKAPPQNF
jgi:hypothetical protein